MKQLSETILWDLLLQTKALVKKHLHDFRQISVVVRNEELDFEVNKLSACSDGDSVIVFLLEPQTLHRPNTLHFWVDKEYLPRLGSNDWMDTQSVDYLMSYLPFCFYPLKAVQLKRTVSMLHFAQSLDGRIAAKNGNSKWIGNHENLVHSHRLRALFDGILIGSNTLNMDKPRLSVRLVSGPDPVKVVVGNFQCEFNSLLENNGKVLFVTSQENHHVNGVESIFVPKKGNRISPLAILHELYLRGIHSVFIEGGAFTASTFLSAKSIDRIQLFISPKILGSGISSFTLQEIAHINESVTFSGESYTPMGDGILFSGDVNYKE